MQPGARVALTRLRSRFDLNGCRATLVRCTENGRWEVTLDDSSRSAKVSVAADNLQLLPRLPPLPLKVVRKADRDYDDVYDGDTDDEENERPQAPVDLRLQPGEGTEAITVRHCARNVAQSPSLPHPPRCPAAALA